MTPHMPQGVEDPQALASHANLFERGNQRWRDPASMTSEERLAEIASILATGYRRHALNLRNALADQGQLEAQCDQAVDGGSSALDPGSKEVA